MILDTVYWTLSAISLCFWFAVYTLQIYSRTKDINNISYFLSLLWFLSDALVLFCSIITFKTLENIIVIEVLIFVVFDITGVIQYIYLSKKFEKSKILFTAFIIVLYTTLCTVGYYYNEIITPLTWMSILILVVSRIPQIVEYCKYKVPNPKIVLFVLISTIFANSLFFTSVIIDTQRKNDVITFLPWIGCKGLIISLDIVLIFIVLLKKNNKIRDSNIV